MLGSFIVYYIFCILQCLYIKREASVAPKEKAPAVTGAFLEDSFSIPWKPRAFGGGLRGKKS